MTVIFAKVFRYLKSWVHFSVIISLCLYFVQFWNKDNLVLQYVVICNFVSFSKSPSALVLSESEKIIQSVLKDYIWLGGNQ